MSRYTEKYKHPYTNNSKLIKDGTVDKIKALREDGKSLVEIAQMMGYSKQRVQQIYSKAIAKRA